MADDEDLVRRLTKAFGVQPRHLGSVPHGPLGLLHAVGLAEKQKLLRLRLDRSDVDAIRRFPALVEAAHGKAVETANRNYVVAKNLEQKLAAAKGVAAVTGLFSLAMVVGNAIGDE